MRTDRRPDHPAADPFEIEQRLRAFDWSATSVGPMCEWPASLRTAVGLVLDSPVASELWWGAELTVVASNAALLRHVRDEARIGTPADTVWAHDWAHLAPAAEATCRNGRPAACELVLEDGALPSRAWFSAVRSDDGGPGGLLLTIVPHADDAGRVELTEANRAKDEFLAMLGHELRNPLAPIHTALHLLALRSGADGARERAIIQRQVNHLTRLVDDLLDVSRITRGKVQLEVSTVAMHEILAKSVEMVAPLMEERRHHLELRVADVQDAMVRGDSTRLAQVFANLLTNAAKYTPFGGRIDVVGRSIGDDIEVRVRDNGLGIQPEMLPRLFEPFSQSRQAIDRAGGGLGLGLAIVRGIVSAHGGTVTAASEGRYRGSEFVVTLPASEATPEEITDPAAAPDPPSPARILVVDDNREAATLLAELLRENGHEVSVAFDGFEALRIARVASPEIAFLDIGLPVVDGYEICRKFRADSTLADMRIVALTGYGNEEARRRTAEGGFDAHVIKPATGLKLSRLIATLQRARRSGP